MCEWGNHTVLLLKIPADLSHTGYARWKDVKIDSCIADIVDALQEAGINMRWSCCGHGESQGHIDLQDGRVLVLTTEEWMRAQCPLETIDDIKVIPLKKEVLSKEESILFDTREVKLPKDYVAPFIVAHRRKVNDERATG